MCQIEKDNFEVKVVNSEVVAAALPMQACLLPLSNLDFLLPPVDVGVFFCYDNQETSSFEHMVAILKKALSQTLVSYYVFAGELVKNGTGEQEILCNNIGVDFREAFADVELKDVDLYNPDKSVQGKLVPARKRRLLAIQVTQLKLGGLVVGCTFSHQVADAYSANLFLVSWAEMARKSMPPSRGVEGKLVPPRNRGVLVVQVTQLNRGGLVVACTFAHQVADAYSANMFLISWAEMAQSKPTSRPPSFRRSRLLPRRPGSYDLSVDDMYVTISSLPSPPEDHPQNDDAQSALSRIYYIKADRLNELQSLVNGDTSKRTKLEAFCAYLWKTILAGGISGGDSLCRLGIVVDGRSRLIDGEDEKEANLISSYFGNVLSIPFGEKKIRDLKQNSLNWVANEVHEFLHTAITKEHFLGLIDWVEEHRPEPAQSRIYASKATEEEPAVVVSSGQQFPIRKIDFGWGLPVLGSYHFPWGGKSGYVMPMPSPKGNGDWIVYMHLLKGQLELVESNAAHVFNPLTSHYLLN